jgi:hypothetical protein
MTETLMKTPQHEIDSLNKTLNGPNIEFLREDVVFGVAHRIVKYQDPDLLHIWPQWVIDGVHEICAMYERDGHFGYVSNIGEVDHSAMVKQLVELLKPLKGHWYQVQNKH